MFLTNYKTTKQHKVEILTCKNTKYNRNTKLKKKIKFKSKKKVIKLFGKKWPPKTFEEKKQLVKKIKRNKS